MASIGQTLAGRYRLGAAIGSGGFATVFRARDLRLERDVAVKVLTAGQPADPVIAERFDREARLLASIDHPNVIAIHDVERADPATGTEPFLVMDFCDGGSLGERLAASPGGGLPPDSLVPILVDVAGGLEAIHSRGIVHRDLKPSNILLADGRARIADLGIAADGTSELTDAGTMVGTLAYLAPEQLAGAPASMASDVHALGVIAFLGLTGRLPRPARNLSEVVAASAGDVPSVSDVRPDLGSRFDAVIARALDIDPERRPTAAELATGLDLSLGEARAAGTAAGADATTLMAIPVPHRPVDEPAASLAAIPVPDPPVPTPAPPVVDAASVAAAPVPLTKSPAAFEPAVREGSLGSTPRARPALSIEVVVLIVAGVIGLVVLLGGVLADRAPSLPGASGATPSATATPAPSLAADPNAEAANASKAMRDAIAAARGNDGLNGRDAKDLDHVLDAFDKAVKDGDAGGARDAAGELADRVASLVDGDGIDAQLADRLTAAADRLVEVAAALD